MTDFPGSHRDMDSFTFIRWAVVYHMRRKGTLLEPHWDWNQCPWGRTVRNQLHPTGSKTYTIFLWTLRSGKIYKNLQSISVGKVMENNAHLVYSCEHLVSKTMLDFVWTGRESCVRFLWYCQAVPTPLRHTSQDTLLPWSPGWYPNYNHYYRVFY